MPHHPIWLALNLSSLQFRSFFTVFVTFTRYTFAVAALE
jgi:hypothetical protein